MVLQGRHEEQLGCVRECMRNLMRPRFKKEKILLSRLLQGKTSGLTYICPTRKKGKTRKEIWSEEKKKF